MCYIFKYLNQTFATIREYINSLNHELDRRELLYRTKYFENVISGNMSNAVFEIEILNIIQDDYLKRRPFKSVAEFLVRYNHKSSLVKEDDVEDYREKILSEKVNSFIKNSNELNFSDFKTELELYKRKLQEILPDPIDSYHTEAVSRRYFIIYEGLYSPLASEQCR